MKSHPMVISWGSFLGQGREHKGSQVKLNAVLLGLQCAFGDSILLVLEQKPRRH